MRLLISSGDSDETTVSLFGKILMRNPCFDRVMVVGNCFIHLTERFLRAEPAGAGVPGEPRQPSFSGQIVTPTNGEEHILFRYNVIFLFPIVAA